jgi:hypothetical protein
MIAPSNPVVCLRIQPADHANEATGGTRAVVLEVFEGPTMVVHRTGPAVQQGVRPSQSTSGHELLDQPNRLGREKWPGVDVRPTEASADMHGPGGGAHHLTGTDGFTLPNRNRAEKAQGDTYAVVMGDHHEKVAADLPGKGNDPIAHGFYRFARARRQVNAPISCAIRVRRGSPVVDDPSRNRTPEPNPNRRRTGRCGHGQRRGG